MISIGSTELIPNDLACEVYNVIGTEDWASRVCNGGRSAIERRAGNAKTWIIKQREIDAVVRGHYIKQPDYQTAIKDFIINEIGGCYEIY